MLHVGNDIVDLCTNGSVGRAENIRFVDRVLTDAEKKVLLCQQESPDSLLWALWAAKETAYKAVNKSFPQISSAPRRYAVTLEGHSLKSKTAGWVITPEGPVAISILVRDSHVHCVGITGKMDDLDRIFWGIKRIDSESGDVSADQQSVLARKFAEEKIAHSLNLDASDINIQRTGKKESGPPAVFLNRHRSGMDISLSHHGRYVAFAVQDVKKELNSERYTRSLS